MANCGFRVKTLWNSYLVTPTPAPFAGFFQDILYIFHIYFIALYAGNCPTVNSLVSFSVDMNDFNSAAFESEVLLICSALGEALDSLHACYVDDFNCDQDYRVTAYIVIDAELNYLDKRVTQTLIRNELINYDGRSLAGFHRVM